MDEPTVPTQPTGEIPPPAVAPPTCSLGTWSLLLGMLGLVSCGLLAIPGIICGAVGLSRINNSGGRLGGRQMAMAGLVVSIACTVLGMFFVPIAAGLILPVLARARESARRTACASNLNQIAKACYLYADVSANGDKFPTKLSQLCPTYIVDTRVFKCPSHGKAGTLEQSQIDAQADYVLVGGLSADNPATCVLLYDRHPHGDMVNVAYVSGVVEIIPVSKLKTLLANQDAAPPP